MQLITDEINTERANRQLEYEENVSIRKLIGDKINEYKAHETEYKKAMEAHQTTLQDY